VRPDLPALRPQLRLKPCPQPAARRCRSPA
jgi:hypothetical protein